MLRFGHFYSCPHLLRWALHFATVDVIDDIMGRTTINGASDRLSGAQDLLDGA